MQHRPCSRDSMKEIEDGGNLAQLNKYFSKGIVGAHPVGILSGARFPLSTVRFSTLNPEP